MPTKTAHRSRIEFAADDLFTPAEIAETLKETPRAVRQWVHDGKIDPEGVIHLPRAIRIYGWALTEFINERHGSER